MCNSCLYMYYTNIYVNISYYTLCCKLSVVVCSNVEPQICNMLQVLLFCVLQHLTNHPQYGQSPYYHCGFQGV